MNFSREQSRSWIQRLPAALLIVYWGSLFVSTHMRMPDLGDLPQNSDKVMHFVAYGGLSFLLGLWWSGGRPMNWQLAVRVFTATVLYAVVDELLQTIPFLHRTGDVLDALADCLGSLIGLAALALGQAMLRRLCGECE